jgi:hypothetical protein
MRPGFTFLLSQRSERDQHIIHTMLLKCHRIQLKLMFGPRKRIIGPAFFKETINIQE